MELKNIFENENEKPLDTIPEDGGYTAIFRTIACVGDSLSSGEFEANNGKGRQQLARYVRVFVGTVSGARMRK